MEYAEYPEQYLDESVFVTLDGATSLGINLRSRFGGEGCYVDGFMNDTELDTKILQSSSSLKIGDTLISINGDSTLECTVEEIHRKVQSLPFPIRLHFQRNNLPTLDDLKQDITSIKILCYYSWIKRFIKSLQSEIDPTFNYHSVLAMWSRVFQVTVWLNTIFIEEQVFSCCKQEHLNRIAHALIIAFPFPEKETVPLQEYYTFLRSTMTSYLTSTSVQDFLLSMIHSFSQSDELRRMVAFNPRFNYWEFIPIADMLQSSAGLLTLCSVVPKSVLWIQMFSAYQLLGNSDSSNDITESDKYSEANLLVLEITITVIEQGILRRIYESDAYVLYLRHLTSPTFSFFRDLFRLLPRSFSLHHYEYGKQPVKTNPCLSPPVCTSIIRLEFNVIFNHVTRTKEFHISHFSIIDCGKNDEIAHDLAVSWWKEVMGIDEGNLTVASNRIIRHLCPQIESNILTSISDNGILMPKAPVGFVVHQLLQNSSRRGFPTLFYVASMATFSETLFSSHHLNAILASLCAVDATDTHEPSTVNLPMDSCETRSVENMRFGGSKIMNEMLSLSSRLFQPVRSVIFPAIGEKRLSQADSTSLASSMDMTERQPISNVRIHNTYDNDISTEEKEEETDDNGSSEVHSTMKGMMLSMTNKLWGRFHPHTSDHPSVISEEISPQIKDDLSLKPAMNMLAKEESTSTKDIDGFHISSILTEKTCLDTSVTHNIAISDSLHHNTNEENTSTMPVHIEPPNSTPIASVACLISTEPKLRTLRDTLPGLLSTCDTTFPETTKRDEWCFDILAEQMAPGLVYLLFHAFLLEVSVVLVCEDDETAVDPVAADIVPVLLTEWLCRAMAPLQWPHTIAVKSPSEIVLPLLQCPTPVWLALPRSVYQFHTQANDKRLIPSETMMVVDLARQEVYWPSLLYDTLSSRCWDFCEKDRVRSSTLERKDPAKKIHPTSKKKTGDKEYLVLFRLASLITDQSNHDTDDTTHRKTTRFTFAPMSSKNIGWKEQCPLFFVVWCRYFAPVSYCYASSVGRFQDRQQVPPQKADVGIAKDTSPLFDSVVAHAIPIAWTTLPVSLLSLQDTNIGDVDDIGRRSLSQTMQTVQNLCHLFVQQLLYGMQYLLVDVSVTPSTTAKKDTESEQGCLCLDEDLFLWVKTQQACTHRSSASNLGATNLSTTSSCGCFFAHEFYLRVFVKRWLRSQALSVYLTTKRSL